MHGTTIKKIKCNVRNFKGKISIENKKLFYIYLLRYGKNKQ